MDSQQCTAAWRTRYDSYPEGMQLTPRKIYRDGFQDGWESAVVTIERLETEIKYLTDLLGLR